jgi:hypothetical protein
MRSVLTAVTTLLMFQAAQAAATQYVDFINDSASSVVSIEVTPAGVEDWIAVTLNGSHQGSLSRLEGGFSGQATTVIDKEHGCIYDVRIDFSDHEPLLLTGWNLCRAHVVRIGEQWRRGLLERSAR